MSLKSTMKLYPTYNISLSLNIEDWCLQIRQENISNIYVSSFVSILLFSYLCYERKNIQNSTLAIINKNKVFIHKFDQ